MRRINFALTALLMIAATASSLAQQTASYHGFDRNLYPGDELLPALRQSFQFTGYWLNDPPGESSNSWTGKRAILKENGFGFLVLFRGRTYSELKDKDAETLGSEDARAAVAAAMREGFPYNVIIFLDQEEGGRLLPEQAAYLFSWIDAVRKAGARAGVYCSGIPVPDGPGGKTTSTVQDIVNRLGDWGSSVSPSKLTESRRLALWIANDACPPSQGCAFGDQPMPRLFPESQVAYQAVWQYAQSPRRAQFSAGCPRNQSPDGMCFAPGIPHTGKTFIDLNTAQSPNPSEEP